MQQHKAMRALTKSITGVKASKERIKAIQELCSSWNRHASLERNIAYPMFEEAGVDEALISKAEIQGDLVSILVQDLINREQDDPWFEAVLEVLVDCAMRAMDAEENQTTGLYTKAKSENVDLVKLAKALNEASSQRVATAMGPHLLNIPSPKGNKEEFVMRGTERERDERGRFVEEDDRRGRGASSRGGYYGRGSSRYDDDEGRGWHGDPQGHAEASRRGWAERREHYRGRDYDDDDRRYGRYGRDDDYDEDRGYRSRDYDDDRRGSRGRSSGYESDRSGRRSGGWFGDSEGHAEASRRGWDNPDHGPSGWYGDREGHREAAQRGWDNPDHGPSGWYGDREGHREASRRGWDNPDHGPSGWYGDPEGHAEASRRGWDDRRRSSSSRRR